MGPYFLHKNIILHQHRFEKICKSQLNTAILQIVQNSYVNEYASRILDKSQNFVVRKAANTGYPARYRNIKGLKSNNRMRNLRIVLLREIRSWDLGK